MVIFHQNGTICAHGEPRAQLLLTVSGPDGNRNDFLGLTALPDSKCFLQGDLVERIYAHLYPFCDNA